MPRSGALTVLKLLALSSATGCCLEVGGCRREHDRGISAWRLECRHRKLLDWKRRWSQRDLNWNDGRNWVGHRRSSSGTTGATSTGGSSTGGTSSGALMLASASSRVSRLLRERGPAPSLAPARFATHPTARPIGRCLPMNAVPGLLSRRRSRELWLASLWRADPGLCTGSPYGESGCGCIVGGGPAHPTMTAIRLLWWILR